MLKNLKTYLKEGFSYAGLEISEADGQVSHSLLKLKKSKNELVLTDTISLNGLEELPGHLKKNKSVFLIINTAAVLTKKVEGTSTKNPEALVNQAFPNLDLNNFYYEVFTMPTESVVTISKKEPIDALLAKLKGLKIQVSRFSLGVASFTNILPFLEKGAFSVSNKELVLEDHAITDIRANTNLDEQHYTVNGLQLSNRFLLPFSQIVGHLGKQVHITNFEEVCQGLQWESKNHRIFNQVLKYALAFFITLLLGNFFVYDLYHDKVSELNAAMAATSSQKDELTLLGESVQKKQERVETLSSSGNSKATYYLDLFAKDIPSSVLLTGIKYQPLAKPVRESKPILLEEETMLVSGISKGVNEFSFWIEELERYGWVNSVETLDYDYVSKNTSKFLLEIGFYENRQ